MFERLARFGSALHANQRPDGDLGSLVEFDLSRGRRPVQILWVRGGIIENYGCKNTPGFLSRYFRDQGLAEVKLL
jgi:hypothetical protein